MSETRDEARNEQAAGSGFDALLRDAAETPSVTRRRLQAGSTLLHGRFILERQLGAGGMGVVYQALDTITGTRCALKMLTRIDPANVYRAIFPWRHLRHWRLDSGSWCRMF